MKTIGALTTVMSMGLINAYVLTFFWLWFIVPFGIMELSLSHAYGLTILIGIITPSNDSKEEEKEMYTIVLESVVKTIFRITLSLPIGYLVHQIMIGG